jgi:transglutaminase-like putative cysteine protease
LERLHKDRGPAGLDAYQFCFESSRIRLHRTFGDYARQSLTPARPLREALLDLTERIHRDFQFQSKVTHVGTTVEEVFEKRRGVCQDFAHLEIACLRSLGLAARYISGYLRTIPPSGKPRLVGADASHAWLSVYCPGSGWLDLDPTNNMVAANDHITVAWGRDYSDVSPLHGLILGGGLQALKVAVDVEQQNQAA